MNEIYDCENGMCAVCWKPGVFTQVGFTLAFPPHFLYSLPVHKVGIKGRWVPLGNSPAITKQHKALVFQGLSLFHPNHYFVFFSFDSLYFFLIVRLSMHHQIKVSQDGKLRRFKQWPKGLLGRRRLAAIIANTSLCINCTRLCHFNKIDLLTYLLCVQIIQVFHKNSTGFNNIGNNQITRWHVKQMTRWHIEQMTR